MLKQKIKVLVQTTVSGPSGTKLRAGSTVDLDDSGYTRLLIKSGTVSLIDPPSLDPSFLENGGYELQEGYSYEDLKKTAVVEEKPKKTGKRISIPKKTEPVTAPEPKESDEQSMEAASEENSQSEDSPKESFSFGGDEQENPVTD